MQLTEWEASYLERHELELDSLLTGPQVVETGLLPGTPLTLKKSRYTGLHFGATAPKWQCIGSNIFYTPRGCFEWRRRSIREGGVAA